ncbi:MAG: aminotransferase class V-fold PLP-dependent enzyme, partial [Verrucomicrobiota bacterium]
MSIDRKTFLRRAALGAAGLVAGASSQAQSSAGAAPRALAAYDPKSPEAFWRDVRAQYPLTRELTYFNTGGLGPACRPALEAMQATTTKLQERAEHGHGLFAGARATTAKFIGAETAEIAFVRNATEGNAIVAAGLKLSAGDEVIFESHAHPGGSFPWLQQQRLRGVVVKIFEPSTGSAEENLERIQKLMTRRTRAVQVSHITAPTGIVLPAVEIGKLCRERGVWFHVDAAQSVGMVPVSVRELGCDSLATSGHKWLGAPLETGILFVRKDRLDDVQPTLVGAYSGDVAGLPGELKLDATAVRYEYGTRNSAAAVG